MQIYSYFYTLNVKVRKSINRPFLIIMNRKWGYLAGAAALLFLVAFFYQKYRVAPDIDLAALRLRDAEGRPVSLSEWDGRKKVVCFSASWCPNCRQELSDIRRVMEDLPGVQVLVISDEPQEEIDRFREKTGYPFTFLKLEANFGEIGIHSIPVSLIVNGRQEITKKTVGYLDWKDPSTRAHLKALME